MMATRGWACAHVDVALMPCAHGILPHLCILSCGARLARCSALFTADG